MIQLGLNFHIPLRGFFALERDLLHHTLLELEGLLGYEKGRLKHGADIYILNPPIKTADFDIMGTSVFPGHRMEGSNLYHAINSAGKKEEHLSLFRRQRLAKVLPLQIHLEAMRKHLSDSEYNLLKDTDTKGRTVRQVKAQWKEQYTNSPAMLKKVDEIFDQSGDIYARVDINDALYPSATNSGVRQWKLNAAVMARCVCRLTDYTEDRYEKVF